MTEAKPRGCTNSKVRQLMRCLGQHYDAEVSQCGLRTTQYSLLTHVVRLGPLRPVDLAAEMKMTPSTLSRNLQPMVAGGWVSLVPGADARSRWVQATGAGEAKWREAQAHWKVAQQKLNAQLGSERVAALHSLIDDSLALLAAGGDAEMHGG
jgi:DNA-binding MarR family transcriptional regulator